MRSNEFARGIHAVLLSHGAGVAPPHAQRSLDDVVREISSVTFRTAPPHLRTVLHCVGSGVVPGSEEKLHAYFEESSNMHSRIYYWASGTEQPRVRAASTSCWGPAGAATAALDVRRESVEARDCCPRACTARPRMARTRTPRQAGHHQKQNDQPPVTLGSGPLGQWP